MRTILFISMVILATGAFAQVTEERVVWNEGRLLEWKDFKAAPNPQSPFYAETSSGISHSFSVKQSDIILDFEYEVNTYFRSHESWVKSGERSPYLLGHEQLHFNITELHARKLRKALEAYEIDRNFKRDLRSIYDSILRESEKMQHQFDAETRHSLNRNAEMAWRNLVRRELEKLEDFAE